MIAEEQVNRGLSILKVIWFAMLAVLGILMVAAVLVGENLQTSLPENSLAILTWGFYGIAFINLIIPRVIRRFLLSAGRFKGQATEGYEYPVMQKYTVASIISWALSLSIGIDGFVLFLLGKNPTDLYVLILISVAAMAVYRPNRDEIMSLTEAATTNPLPPAS